MSILVIVLHIIVCIALIMIVLLQTGKGADMGAAFGGGSSQTLFGSTGASTFLSKATTVAAVVFMLTSLTLAYMSGNQNANTIMENVPAPVEQSTPAPSGTDNAGAAQPSAPAAPAPAPAPADSK
jgi:preprotein translocase subunit SecG